MNERKELRSLVRKVLKEEINSEKRKKLKNQTCQIVSEAIDKLFIDQNIHKEGLSEQQASTIFRCVLKTLDEKLDEFTSKQRPNSFKNYKHYIQKYNL